jgi:hypothetical protein
MKTAFRQWLFAKQLFANPLLGLACRMELDCTDEAFTLLRSCLAQFEDDFLSLGKELNGLDVLAKTL